MRIAVCIDENWGMLFCKRRQSQDRQLRRRLLDGAGEHRLWMNVYSAKQFEPSDRICVDEDFLEKAGPEDLCFVEDADILPFADKIRQVRLYHWNRRYPSTEFFPREAFEGRWQLESREEFPGSSHETVTEEVYCL